MNAGKYRHQVTLCRRDLLEPDEDGEQLDEYVEVETVAAKVAPIAGREAWVARQAEATTTHLVETRYRPDIELATTWRLLFNGRVFDIDGIVNVDERNREWRISVTEKV